MKKLFLLGAMALSFLSFSLTSCDPEKPNNGAEEKEHDDPSVVEYSFQEGTLKDGAIKGAFADDANFEPMQIPAIKVKTEVNDEGKASGQTPSTPIMLKANTWYKLSMTFINKNGTILNPQFYEKDEQMIHQFFFMPKALANNIEYYYADKVDGKLTDTPIGFVGFIRFTKPVNEDNLNIILVHVTSGSKLDANGNAAPFNNPGKRLLDYTDMDANLKIKVAN